MLRDRRLHWAILIIATLALTACSHQQSDIKKNQKRAALYYDDYYGKPPAYNHRGAQKSTQKSRHTPHHAGHQHRLHARDIKHDAPRRYVVKRGDTLWSIAQKFLHHPWKWPYIWHKNQRVRNPHLIYPGDVLYLDYGQHAGTSHNINIEKLTPRMRIDRSGSRPGQPISLLAPFFQWPLLMDKHEIKQAPYVVASRNDAYLITKGETVYIRNLKNTRMGTRLGVYHPNKPIYDADHNRLLGVQLDYAGKLRLEKHDTLSSAEVLEVERPIRKGDRIFPVPNNQQALRAPMQIPKQKVRGRVIALQDAEYLSAACMIIAIDRGKQHGIKPGHILGVYHDGRVIKDQHRYSPKKAKGTRSYWKEALTQLPPERVGEAIIYDVKDQISYGLVLDSEREIKNGDRIGNP